MAEEFEHKRAAAELRAAGPRDGQDPPDCLDGDLGDDELDLAHVEPIDDELVDDELVDDELVDDELVDDELVDDELVDDTDDAMIVAVAPAALSADDDEEDEDEPDDDDVEASLDVILKERLVVASDDEDDEDAADADDRSDLAVKVLPKQPDEFVCQSCFLVKHPSQLADPARVLCRDCV